MNGEPPEISFDLYTRTVLAFMNEEGNHAEAVRQAESFLSRIQGDYARFLRDPEPLDVNGSPKVPFAKGVRQITGLSRTEEALRRFEDFVQDERWSGISNAKKVLVFWEEKGIPQEYCEALEDLYRRWRKRQVIRDRRERDLARDRKNS
jgi:hypothetical protein